MYTREGANQRATEHFLKTLLTVLGCENTLIKSAISSGPNQIICGFSNPDAEFVQKLLILFPHCKLNINKDEYLVFISYGAVESQFNSMFAEVIEQVPAYLRGYCKKNKFILDEKIIGTRHGVQIIETLAEFGLGVRQETYIDEDDADSSPTAFIFQPHGFFSPRRFSTFRRHDFEAIVVDGFTNYEKFIRSSKRIVELNRTINRSKKIALLSGFHKRLGEESSMFKFKKESQFDINVIYHGIFSWLDAAPVHSMPEESKPRNINEENDFVNEIKNRISELCTEINTWWWYWNKDLKSKKVDFLYLVLYCKEANPTFSMKSCIEFVEKNNPALYQQAIQGDMYTTTKDLLNKICNPELTISHSSHAKHTINTFTTLRHF